MLTHEEIKENIHVEKEILKDKHGHAHTHQDTHVLCVRTAKKYSAHDKYLSFEFFAS